MTVRLATAADATALRSLFVAVKPELLLDGALSEFTRAEFLRLIAAGYMKVVVDAVPAIQGCVLFVRKPEGWEILLVMTNKTLPLLQRVASVGRIYKAACASVPPETIVYGNVKTGGNLAQWIEAKFGGSPSLEIRPAGPGFTYYGGRADEMVARL